MKRLKPINGIIGCRIRTSCNGKSTGLHDGRAHYLPHANHRQAVRQSPRIDRKPINEIEMESSPIHTAQAQQDVVWQKLSQLVITPPSNSLTFEARLAREQAWSLDRALAVVEEYRKFLYLLLTCSHPVTPSEDVDAAWHLHLLYTRSYYEDLCQNIAGFLIHHQPTAGGAVEGHKFRDWYQKTSTPTRNDSALPLKTSGLPQTNDLRTQVWDTGTTHPRTF